MSDIYKYASQNVLRFDSGRGQLTAEQLFQLPLTSKTGFDLNTIAKSINAELKGASEESFVEDVSDNPGKARLTVALEIVKDVISTKQAENKAAATRVARAADRRKILDAMAAKKDANLSAASMEDLEKQLAALDA